MASSYSKKNGKGLSLDRSSLYVMIVSADSGVNSQLKQALKALGFANLTTSSLHTQGLEKLNSRPFSHIFYDAKDSDMPAKEFTEKVLRVESDAVLVAISKEPRIDDVFSLLRAGARSFLVPPFTTDMVEEVLGIASEGPQLSDAVLTAPDRNAAFTAVILNNLYRLSVAMRQLREFPSAQRDVDFYNYALRESVEMAMLFCEGSDEDLRDKIVEGCINRAKDAATRLGRLRKRLRKSRMSDLEDSSSAAETA